VYMVRSGCEVDLHRQRTVGNDQLETARLAGCLVPFGCVMGGVWWLLLCFVGGGVL
jgi:hypothetical protein